MNRIIELDVTGLQKLLHRRKISSKDILHSYIYRIEQFSEKINCWEAMNFESAINEAERIDRKGFRNERVLNGIPFSVKDNIYTKGLETKAGTRALKGFIPKVDAPYIRNIKRNGGILMGKNSTTELAISNVTKTRNPKNVAYSPGGSSSGSAAAVSSNMIPFSLGTQTGGSLIRPAAFCGIVSIKPTSYWAYNDGIVSISPTLDTVGVFTKSVRDQLILLPYLIRCDHNKWGSFQNKITHKSNPLKGLKIGVPYKYFYEDTDMKIVQTIKDFIRILESAGAIIVPDIELYDDYNKILDAHLNITKFESYKNLMESMKIELCLVSPYTKEFILEGKNIDAITYDQNLKLRRKLLCTAKDLFANIDLIITPVTSEMTPKGNYTGSAEFNIPFVMNGLPVLTMPVGIIISNNLPVGVQIVGKHYSEEKLISIGSYIEKILDL